MIEAILRVREPFIEKLMALLTFKYKLRVPLITYSTARWLVPIRFLRPGYIFFAIFKCGAFANFVVKPA